MRTIAVLGASGKTGRPLVADAVARGWRVRALVRDASRAPPGAEPVVGDATDAEAVARVVRGADAVVILLGHAPGSAPDVITRGVENAVAAMRAEGPRRVVMLTGGGVAALGDRPKMMDIIMRFALRRLQPALLADAAKARDVLASSGLDWTVVRVGRMQERPARGRVRVGVVGTTRPLIPHADAAAFILDLVESGERVGEQPMISS